METDFPNARISGKDILYLMKSNTCSIGRDINSKIDIIITASSCISRTHLKIISRDNKLFLKCFGKNGIFINKFFQVYSLDEVPLPSFSVIRFPSTDIELQIESKSYLIENCIKKYPLKKRLFSISKENDSLGLEDNYLSESSIDATDLSLQKNLQSGHHQSAVETIAHSPTDQGTDTVKPPYSYAQLIIQAIVSGESQQMTLSEIYRFISKNFPFYKMNQKGWQNSIRHNLSLNRYFIRVPRSHNNCGKSAYWKLDKAQEAQLIKQAFWKRRMKNSFVVFNKPETNSEQNSHEKAQPNTKPVMPSDVIQESNTSNLLNQPNLSDNSLSNFEKEIAMYHTPYDII